MSPVFDRSARRAVVKRDQGAVIDNLIDGVSSLHAQVASMPHVYLREHHLAAVERTLALLRGLVSELRALVTPTAGGAA